MLKVNPNYEKLPGSYLFAEIARRVKEYTQAHPDADVIRLGIGDVTRPLAPAVVEAFEKAANGQATKIIIPSEIQGVAGLAKSLGEVLK